MAKLTKRKLLKMDPSQIGRLPAPELRNLLRGARQLFNAQQKALQKYEKTVYSHALDLMETYYKDNGRPNEENMGINRMRDEVFRLKEFFDSKSSTVPGARKIAIEQDRLIYGVKENSNMPRHRMTLDQRRRFWSAYEEFYNMKKEAYFRQMGSDRIQQFLGAMAQELTTKNSEPYFGTAFFKELDARLKADNERQNAEMNNYEHGNNDVFSGKRDY